MGNKVIDINDPLIAACKQQDVKAQFELYQKYSGAMFNIALRMLDNREDAEDVLQDSFVDAFKHIERFDGRVTFGAWLKRIVINKSINMLKRRNLLHWKNLDFDVPQETEETELVIDPKKLKEAVQQLPVGCRAIFTMKAYEGLEHKEIAQFLDISLSTSKTQFSRAKELLRVSLSKNLVS